MMKTTIDIPTGSGKLKKLSLAVRPEFSFNCFELMFPADKRGEASEERRPADGEGVERTGALIALSTIGALLIILAVLMI